MKKILVVEDEAILLQALSGKLTKEGYQVLEARDGRQGLEIALSVHPDLILLDIIMPVMDGMAMLKKLREDEWGKNVPVLILTNLSDNQKIDESLRQGVFDYLTKTNWSLDDLVKRIKVRLT